MNDRTHYHLVYATRSLTGLVTFREVERNALKQQGAIRNTARTEKRVERSGQPELFGPQVMGTNYLDEVIGRHHRAAHEEVVKTLRVGGVVNYDDLLGLALAFPAVAEATLKGWLDDLKKQGDVRYEGLVANERKPKKKRRHRVVWTRP